MHSTALGIPGIFEQKPPILMIRQADNNGQITVKDATVLERQFADKDQELQRLTGSNEEEAEKLKPSERSMYNSIT